MAAQKERKPSAFFNASVPELAPTSMPSPYGGESALAAVKTESDMPPGPGLQVIALTVTVAPLSFVPFQ